MEDIGYVMYNSIGPDCWNTDNNFLVSWIVTQYIKDAQFKQYIQSKMVWINY